ncbi:YopX family protein [Enterococcus dongliensis]|uniref:YopX family protein n=1 Tax=Enterococcus dongliensis TaxID=2559925 RepID=UPI00289035EB|nr:YopX family protein [Enterococcus dongliensis]MDT2640445.1 YopX family protein [Enterococcus dongliensis]
MIPKFRAWDEDSKVMRSWKDLILEKDGGDDFWLIGYKENACITSFDHDQILMQSTGLKDKNGVEIFEGDIVKIIGDVLGDDMSVIRFTEGGFYLDYKNLDTEFELLYSIDLPIEIIGNIYENPELLEAIE